MLEVYGPTPLPELTMAQEVHGPPTVEELCVFHKDMAAAMLQVGYVQKDGYNDFNKYKFASADAVFTKVREALSPLGIAVESHVDLVQYGPGYKDTPTAVVHVTLTFRRGQCSVQMQGLGQGADKGDKAVMKANTAAVKYALSSGFLISWGDDPEAADTTTDKDAKTTTKKTPQKSLDFDELMAKVVGVKDANAANLLKPQIAGWRGQDIALHSKLKTALQGKIKGFEETS